MASVLFVLLGFSLGGKEFAGSFALTFKSPAAEGKWGMGLGDYPGGAEAAPRPDPPPRSPASPVGAVGGTGAASGVRALSLASGRKGGCLTPAARLPGPAGAGLFAREDAGPGGSSQGCGDICVPVADKTWGRRRPGGLGASGC